MWYWLRFWVIVFRGVGVESWRREIVMKLKDNEFIKIFSVLLIFIVIIFLLVGFEFVINMKYLGWCSWDWLIMFRVSLVVDLIMWLVKWGFNYRINCSGFFKVEGFGRLMNMWLCNMFKLLKLIMYVDLYLFLR